MHRPLMKERYKSRRMINLRFFYYQGRRGKAINNLKPRCPIRPTATKVKAGKE